MKEILKIIYWKTLSRKRIWRIVKSICFFCTGGWCVYSLVQKVGVFPENKDADNYRYWLLQKLTSIDEIKDDDGITNAGLIQYYKDYVTVNIIKRDILPYCEHKCRKQLKDCLYEKRKWKGYL